MISRLPIIALIGLPNSGKSTLINKLCGSRKAITADEAHTTRDLNWSEAEWEGYTLNIVDTGGLVPDPKDKIQKEIQIKSASAISQADILVWVIDRRQDPDTISEKITQSIWKTGKPVLICINKVDNPNHEKSIADYAFLGGFDFVNVSSANGYGLNSILDILVEKVKDMEFAPYINEVQIDTQKKKTTRSKTANVRANENGSGYYITRNEDGLYQKIDIIQNETQSEYSSTQPDDSNTIPKVIFLGKPNVGKSSIFNAMVGEDIQIVTDVAGTTLSVNDTLIERTATITTKRLVEHPTTEIEEDEIEDSEELDDQDDENKYDSSESFEMVTEEVIRKYILLDSTGIRRPGQRTFGAETFATYRTVEEAHRSDVICLVIDGSEPISHQDQVVAGIIKEARKGVVIIANKSDLVDGEERQKFMKDFYTRFGFLKIQGFIWVSAQKKHNLSAIWNGIDLALENRQKDIKIEDLRKLFNYLMKQKPPAKLRIKKKPIIYDLLYTKKSPPTFELLVKDKETIHWSYLRFLENIIRKNFNFEATEILVKMTEIDTKRVVRQSSKY
jgi:GTPase